MKRLPFRTATVCALLAVAASPALVQAQQDGWTTVVVTRHAEKLDGDDPSLSEAGRARALLLSGMLAESGVEAIYTTPYRRTRETIAPLAAATGLEARTMEARATEELAARILAEHRGDLVVVAGHSNTVPALVTALGAPEVDAIPEERYGDLFVVTIDPEGRATALRVAY